MPFLCSALARRFALACFVWAVGVAGMAPWAAAGGALPDTVCSADGVARWAPAAGAPGDAPALPHAHALDCPACLPASLPPPGAPDLHRLVPFAARHERPAGAQNLRPQMPATAHLPARGPPVRARPFLPLFI